MSDETTSHESGQSAGPPRNHGRVMAMRLTGHLDASQMVRALRETSARLEELGTGVLLVDCLEMDDYDGDARRLFTDWNARYRDRVTQVAVVTEKRLWHMVVSTISLASRQSMRAFDSADEAYEWLNRD